MNKIIKCALTASILCATAIHTAWWPFGSNTEAQKQAALEIKNQQVNGYIKSAVRGIETAAFGFISYWATAFALTSMRAKCHYYGIDPNNMKWQPNLRSLPKNPQLIRPIEKRLRAVQTLHLASAPLTTLGGLYGLYNTGMAQATQNRVVESFMPYDKQA